MLFQPHMGILRIVKRIKYNTETGYVGKFYEPALVIDEAVDLAHAVKFVHYINIRHSADNVLILKEIGLLGTDAVVDMPYTERVEILAEFVDGVVIHILCGSHPPAVMTA